MVPHCFQSHQWNSCVCERRHQPRLLSNGNVLIFGHASTGATQGPHRGHTGTCWIFGGLESVMWSAVMKTEQGVGSSAYNLKCHLSVTESEGCVDVMQMLAVVKGRSQDEQTDSCRSIHWRSARENRLHPDEVVTETRDYREYYSQGKRRLSRRGALTVLCLTHIRCWYMTRNHEKHTRSTLSLWWTFMLNMTVSNTELSACILLSFNLFHGTEATPTSSPLFFRGSQSEERWEQL